MSSNCFCTIITPNYINYALALLESLHQFNSDVELYVLVSEFEDGLKERIERKYSKITILFPSDLCETGIGKEIFDKYHQTFTDGFRWSMKPVLILKILEQYEKVIFVDCDISFYSSYNFLFDELDANYVLITPHWRPSDYHIEPEAFISMYTSGIYNAGFVGVNKRGKDVMQWWAKANLAICEINVPRGQYVDQTHLNLFHVYFDGVKIIKHRGCNVAGWNMVECKRTLVNDVVLINETWPIVFIHYSAHTVQNIEGGIDPLLYSYYQAYITKVNKYKSEIGFIVNKPVAKQIEHKKSKRIINKISNLSKKFKFN